MKLIRTEPSWGYSFPQWKIVYNDLTKRIEYWESGRDRLFPWIEMLMEEEDYPESHHLE